MRLFSCARKGSANLRQWDLSRCGGAVRGLRPVGRGGEPCYTHGRALEGLLSFHGATGEPAALDEAEVMGKAPPLLARGGHFPNGDHGIQPPVTFPNLCRFMTLLHEVCNNPEGEFPRV